MEKKTYKAILDTTDPRGRWWFSGQTRILSEAEARPYVESGKAREYIAEPKKFVNFTDADGMKTTMSWGDYLKRRAKQRLTGV